MQVFDPKLDFLTGVCGQQGGRKYRELVIPKRHTQPGEQHYFAHLKPKDEFQKTYIDTHTLVNTWETANSE